MRLPQSSIRSLVVPTIHLLIIGLALAIFCTVPASVDAAAQQLVCTRTQIEFGAVVLGQTETMLVTLTNTGNTSVTISATAVSNTEFAATGLNLPLALPAGQSADVSISFTPTSLRWTGSTIKFSSNASNAILVLDVGGTGVNSESVTASPSALSFGQVAIGAKSTLPIVLTNARPWALTLWPLQTVGGEFSINTSADAFPLTLARGQSVTVNVTFAPKSAGLTGGGLFIPGPALAIPLVGTGTAATTPGQLTITPASLNFGSVPNGTTATQSVSLSAVGSSVTVSSIVSSASQFALNGATLPMTIAAGQSVSFNVAFTPKNSGTVSGSLSLASNASNSGTAEPLTGTGTAPAPGQLTVTPASLNFGSVPNGTTVTQSVSLSAVGSSVTVSSIVSSASQFALNGATFPMTIAAGQSISFNVAFTPKSSGAVSGSLSFASNASNSGTAEPLTGTGTAPAPGQLTITPASLNFGSVPDGTTTTQSISLSAVGSSVTVSSSASSSSQFVLNGATFPMTIAAGQSVSFNVAFTPQSSGTVSGSLSFASNASSSSTPESLTGIGTATQYNVNLSWNPSSDVTGYNVYRGTTATGKFAKINSSVNPNTAYTDSTVVSGQTYYYAATSVASSGQESALSTPVAASVP